MKIKLLVMKEIRVELIFIILILISLDVLSQNEWPLAPFFNQKQHKIVGTVGEFRDGPL